MAPSKTYILFPCAKTQSGQTVDIVTQRWQADGRWVVGERSPDGIIVFRHRSHRTLEEVCFSRGLAVSDVRKRVIRDA